MEGLDLLLAHMETDVQVCNLFLLPVQLRSCACTGQGSQVYAGLQSGVPAADMNAAAHPQVQTPPPAVGDSSAHDTGHTERGRNLQGLQLCQRRPSRQK